MHQIIYVIHGLTNILAKVAPFKILSGKNTGASLSNKSKYRSLSSWFIFAAN
jgi:hypothetical protein